MRVESETSQAPPPERPTSGGGAADVSIRAARKLAWVGPPRPRKLGDPRHAWPAAAEPRSDWCMWDCAQERGEAERGPRGGMEGSRCDPDSQRSCG